MTIYAAASGEWLTGVASNVARLARVATSGDDSTPNDHIRASGITWTIEALPTGTNAANAARYLATVRFGKALRGRAKSSMTRKGSGVRVPHGPPDSLVRGRAGADPAPQRRWVPSRRGARRWVPHPEPETSTYRPRKPLPRERLSTPSQPRRRRSVQPALAPLHDPSGCG
jgi:hypothetical protein